ncbi:hypothetical protein N7474_003203 [Penicillium riverlandense]|uniref:uncharacterized protein n=1 Tax=Penicillium riverlandense TaxID=1903569 RepID=UPI002547589B|nr:uncharacterized protein N7474_003203 [Penicillium riverlandense]KAJ5826065.1 hypothetical protein N7474_003203 [Penicillium riverlandense]
MLRHAITATALITGSSAVYFYILHLKLSSRVQHESHFETLSASSPRPTAIESVPEKVFTDHNYAFYDRASKTVPRDSLPLAESLESLFTKYVRRNMTAFSHLPAALMLRAVSKTPEQKQSFRTSHIASLNFQEGDLICGAYRVKVRHENKVEFEMKMQTMDFVEGRLALNCREEDGEVVFSTDVMMWKPADEKRTMPMEKPVARWMHELASWWLVDSGVQYLMDL